MTWHVWMALETMAIGGLAFAGIAPLWVYFLAMAIAGLTILTDLQIGELSIGD